MTAFPALALFDVDGTLIDSQHTIVSSMTAAFGAVSLPPPPAEAIRALIGLSVDDFITRLLPDASTATRAAIVQGYRDAYGALRVRPGHSDPLFPGVVAAFDRLEAEGWLLGVATGKSRRGLDAMIEINGLAGRFVTLQTADNNPSKPHPSMILQAVTEAGSATARTVMIGDTSFDMEMAKSAGATAIGVGWGYHPRRLLEAAGADRVADDFPSLPDLLSAYKGSL